MLLNPGITSGIETGIIRGRNANKEDLDAIIQGLSFAGRDAQEILLPKEVKAENIEMAEMHYAKGVELYDYMKFEDSENHLKKAIYLFYKALAYPAARKNVVNALFYLSAIHSITGKDTDAEKDFFSILELNENFEPDRIKFSPKIIEKFKTAKNNRPALPQYAIYICSPYSELTIDGTISVKPPLPINLKRGRHTLVYEGEKYFADVNLTKNVLIYAGKINENDISVFNSDGGRELAERIGGLCGLKEIIFVEKSGSELVIKNHSLNNEFNDSDIVNTNAEKKLNKPFYKKWWFWTGIGVIAGSGVSIYMLTDNTGDKNDSGKVVVKW